jgi:hypothetical protein
MWIWIWWIFERERESEWVSEWVSESERVREWEKERKREWENVFKNEWLIDSLWWWPVLWVWLCIQQLDDDSSHPTIHPMPTPKIFTKKTKNENKNSATEHNIQKEVCVAVCNQFNRKAKSTCVWNWETHSSHWVHSWYNFLHSSVSVVWGHTFTNKYNKQINTNHRSEIILWMSEWVSKYV